jgi:hypothetical protein
VNIETTLTIPVSDIQQQAQQLQLSQETYDSGKVLEELVHAYIDSRLASTAWESQKEELETERDEALAKMEAAELLLKEAKHLTRMLFHTWGQARDARGKAYDTLAEKHSDVADTLADAMADIDGRIDELNYTLNEDK